MKIKITTLLIVLFFTTIISYAQEDSEKSVLWEVSGKNLKEKSYIFGTIHMIPKDDYFFLDIWTDKFETCEVLALEAKMDLGLSEQIQLAMKAKLPEGTTLKDYMTKEDYAKYRANLIDTLGVKEKKLNTYDQLKPFYIYSMVLMEVIDDKIIMYEKELTKKAKKNKMEIVGLETVEFQMSLVDSIPIEKQVEMFLMDDEGGNIKDEYYKSVNLYKQQDIKALHELTNANQSEEFVELMDNFLFKRNDNWIPKIIKLMNKKPTFIAVGAAHLGGERGILNLLKKEGYTVKPIKE